MWWEVMDCIPAAQHASHRTWPTEGAWERLGTAKQLNLETKDHFHSSSRTNFTGGVKFPISAI